MGAFQVKKGFDIPLEGEAPRTLRDLPASPLVAFNPEEFPFMKWRLLVAEGDAVKVGTPIAAAKQDENIVFCSPVAGSVHKIVRGDRRKLLSVVLKNDGSGEAIDFGAWDMAKVGSAGRDALVAHLQKGGLWPLLKQRPFGKLADASKAPKALFVNAMETAPLGADQEFLLADRADEFTLGLQALLEIVPTIHLCIRQGCSFGALVHAQGVDVHTFAGPHPAGLPGTHINMISPINKGETVWTITAYQVSLIGEVLKTGKVPERQIVAVAGSAAKDRGYFRATRGAQISNIVGGQPLENVRAIAGTPLFGTAKGADDCIGLRDASVCLIPEETERHYLLGDQHWTGAGFHAFSTWRLFASRLCCRAKKWALSTALRGGKRAIIQQDVYERFSPLDVPLTTLVKAIPGGDVERLEQLGLYELEPEDVALCTFACPSKVDVAEEIRKGLAILEKEV